MSGIRSSGRLFRAILMTAMLFAFGSIFARPGFAQDTAPAGLAYATATATPPLVPNLSGCPLDRKVTWESDVTDKDLVQGDEGYESARQLCISYNKSFAKAHELRDAGDYLNAAMWAPLYWVRAWYLTNYACSLVAIWDADANEYVYNKALILQNSVKAAPYFAEAKRLNALAVSSGVVGLKTEDKDNSPDHLTAVVNGALKAVNDVLNPPNTPVAKHKRSHKKGKKGLVAVPTSTPDPDAVADNGN